MPKGKPRIDGLKELQTELRKQGLLIHKRAEVGLVQGGLKVRRDAVKNTPRRTGNLRNSAHITTRDNEVTVPGEFKGSNSAELSSQHNSEITEVKSAVKKRVRRGRVQAIAVGFSAVYALVVHENPNAGAAGFDPDASSVYLAGERKGRKKRADDVHSAKGGWKFLENAIKENTKFILQQVAKAVRIKD
jgi:hypothetical protein